MRILLFCDEDLFADSAGDRQVIELAGNLEEKGHEIRIVAPRPRTGGQVSETRRALHRSWVPVVRRSGLRPLSYLVNSAIVLMWEKLRWRPDVLLWFDSPGQLSPWLCAKATRCPYVLFVNGLPFEELQGVWQWAPLRAALTFALKCAAQGAAAVVSVSPEVLSWMQETWLIPAHRCSVIRNGVDTELFCPGDPVEARYRLGLETNRPFVGFVGGFFPWHGLDILIDAVPLVLREIPEICFVLVGDGRTKPALEKRSRELGVDAAVRFPGRVPYRQIPLWIAACDVCVVLHRPVRFYPGDSMKLWEYMACARPVVTTEGPGYGDTVEAIGSGVSVKLDRPDDLARNVIRLLSDAVLRVEMGQRGRASVVRQHTWRSRAEHLEVLLTAAADRRKTS